MFFESTYVPSPPLSVVSIDDVITTPPPLSPSPEAPPTTDSPGEESLADTPIDHLIFVIHGIGQQTEQYGHFYEHIENLQETTRQVLQAKVPDHNVRIELIPIEWHRHIHEQVDPVMNRITLKSIPTIRMIENEYLADVLYYFSKDRGQNITDNVTHLFNTSYHNFLEKHPGFNGKIAILGYSLGGIITWDILSHQRTPDSPEEEADYRKLDIHFSKLDFKPDYFFGLGSPIGAVLTFRNQSPKTYHPDFDIVIENIFHPFDPLAYRLEPLFNEYYTDQSAVLVERSIPLGPSFSFPSMPSLPGIGFFSIFSWRMSSNQAPEPSPAGEVEQVTSDIAGQQEAAEQEMAGETDVKTRDDEDPKKTIMSSVNTFLKYFTKGKGAKADQGAKTDADDSNIGIISWDPLREQTREELMALHNNLNHTLDQNELGLQLTGERPSPLLRSKTLSTPRALWSDSQFSSSGAGNSAGSLGERSLDDTSLLKPHAFSQEAIHKRRHLVEVLGIDGVRVESFERAQANFDRDSQSVTQDKDTLSTPQEDTPGTHPPEPPSEGSSQTTGDKTSSRTPRASDDASSHQSRNLWTDLNKEMNAPGPAITSPGESIADVTADATRTNNKDSHEDQQTSGAPTEGTTKDDDREKTAEEEEAEQQRELEKLPGRQRMDYVLQPENFMSMIANEYLVGLRAHFSYWTNKDFLWHLVRRLESLGDEQLRELHEKRSVNGSSLSLATGRDSPAPPPSSATKTK